MLRDNSPPPAELRTAWDCERFHCLPEAGGLMDQDYQLMNRMKTLNTVYAAVSQWFNLTGTKIHLMSEQTRRVLRWLLDHGINFNA